MHYSKHALFLFRIALFATALLPSADATQMNDVVINEIAWMGTTESYNNEWIELYNNTDAQIDMDGWILRATDGTPLIHTKGVIEPRSFFLLERTDDATLPLYAADQIYTGALGNSGEHLELIDNNVVTIDDVNSWGNWFAGDNTSKQTMERKNPAVSGSDSDTWVTSSAYGGTPRAQNSQWIQQQENSTSTVVNPPTDIDTDANNDVKNNNLNATSTPNDEDLADVKSYKNYEERPDTAKSQNQATSTIENILDSNFENIFVTEPVPSPTATPINEPPQKIVTPPKTAKRTIKTTPLPTLPPINIVASTSTINATISPVAPISNKTLHTASVSDTKKPRWSLWASLVSASLLALMSATLIVILKKRLQ